jgi:hypothetical protein
VEHQWRFERAQVFCVQSLFQRFSRVLLFSCDIDF